MHTERANDKRISRRSYIGDANVGTAVPQKKRDTSTPVESIVIWITWTNREEIISVPSMSV